MNPSFPADAVELPDIWYVPGLKQFSQGTENVQLTWNLHEKSSSFPISFFPSLDAFFSCHPNVHAYEVRVEKGLGLKPYKLYKQWYINDVKISKEQIVAMHLRDKDRTCIKNPFYEAPKMEDNYEAYAM